MFQPGLALFLLTTFWLDALRLVRRALPSTTSSTFCQLRGELAGPRAVVAADD